MIGSSIFKGRLRLNSPFNQNFICGMVLFCLPGIYLALTGLGAGGGQPSSQHVASLTNLILYGVYTVAGWCAGSILNYLKPKYTIALGGLGYPFYVGSLWYFGQIGHDAFPLLAGAVLGVSAALLWTGSGFIQFAYAEEKDKGKYIAYQWVLNSCGSTVGGLIAFGININKTEAVGISAGVYTIFIVIMCIAIVMDLILVVDPKDIVRDDGRYIALFKEPSLKEEIKSIISIMRDPKIIFLFPAMFCGEMVLAMTSSLNGYYFNLRTRSLNNLLFQIIMIPAPLIITTIMDNSRLKTRRIQGLVGSSIVGIVTLACFAGYLGWIIQNNIDRNAPPPAMDWTSPVFGGACILWLLAGFVDACFQLVVQWTLGSLSNDPQICARYAGAFRGTVSLGMCISFAIDSHGIGYRDQAIIQLAIYAVGILCLLYVIWAYVKDTNYFLEDSVIVPVSAEKAMVTQQVVPQEAIENEHAKERLAEEIHGVAKADVVAV